MKYYKVTHNQSHLTMDLVLLSLIM